MGCKSIVRLGRGLWSPWDFCWDGHKYVCEDDFAEEESCLVYTFGVGYEATFEKTMAARGTEANTALRVIWGPILKEKNCIKNCIEIQF